MSQLLQRSLPELARIIVHEMDSGATQEDMDLTEAGLLKKSAVLKEEGPLDEWPQMHICCVRVLLGRFFSVSVDIVRCSVVLCTNHYFAFSVIYARRSADVA